MSNQNERQVGGTHYRRSDGWEQHWDRAWREGGPSYHQWQAIKYLERYRTKHGRNGKLAIQDLEKAKHFIEKLIELETAAMNGTGPLPGGSTPPLVDPDVRMEDPPSVKGQDGWVSECDNHGYSHLEPACPALRNRPHHYVPVDQNPCEGRRCEFCGASDSEEM